MSQSASIVSDFPSSIPAKPQILASLPNLALAEKGCTPYIQQQIDLLLLAVEALELGASENMLATINQLELNDIISGRVALWRLRCSNPWRRSYNRNPLTLEQAKTLVILAVYRAKELEPLIRHLLDAEQYMASKQLPLANHFRLSEYLERFRAHFRSRMNSRRTKIALYLNSESELNELALSLLRKLFFATGTKGLERMWFSLFDGEV